MSTPFLAPPPFPHCMKPLLETFPKMAPSSKFREQIQEIDVIGQRIFDSLNRRATEDTERELNQAMQDLKWLVSFKVQPSRDLTSDFFGPPCPSEKKIKLMYAAATIMGIWKGVSLGEEDYEQHRNFTFIKIFHTQIYKAKSPLLFGLTQKAFENIREDSFWKNNPDLLEAVVHLHKHRVDVG